MNSKETKDKNKCNPHTEIAQNTSKMKELEQTILYKRSQAEETTKNING